MKKMARLSAFGSRFHSTPHQNTPTSESGMNEMSWADKIREKLPELGENEYEVLWERGVLGLIFLESEKDGIPYVSKVTESCISRAVSSGDKLKYVNMIKSKDHSFSDFFKILATMKKPVLLRFERPFENYRPSDERRSNSISMISPQAISMTIDDSQRASSFSYANEPTTRASRSTFWRRNPREIPFSSNLPSNPIRSPVHENTTSSRAGETPHQEKPSLLDSSRNSIATGSFEYEVLWERGSLGLFFGEDSGSRHPIVTRSITTPGSKQVAVNDMLISANGVQTLDYTFEAFFGCLRQMVKPVKLVFRRNDKLPSNSPSPVSSEALPQRFPRQSQMFSTNTQSHQNSPNQNNGNVADPSPKSQLSRARRTSASSTDNSSPEPPLQRRQEQDKIQSSTSGKHDARFSRSPSATSPDCRNSTATALIPPSIPIRTKRIFSNPVTRDLLMENDEKLTYTVNPRSSRSNSEGINDGRSEANSSIPKNLSKEDDDTTISGEEDPNHGFSRHVPPIGISFFSKASALKKKAAAAFPRGLYSKQEQNNSATTPVSPLLHPAPLTIDESNASHKEQENDLTAIKVKPQEKVQVQKEEINTSTHAPPSPPPPPSSPPSPSNKPPRSPAATKPVKTSSSTLMVDVKEDSKAKLNEQSLSGVAHPKKKEVVITAEVKMERNDEEVESIIDHHEEMVVEAKVLSSEIPSTLSPVNNLVVGVENVRSVLEVTSLDESSAVEAQSIPIIPIVAEEEGLPLEYPVENEKETLTEVEEAETIAMIDPDLVVDIEESTDIMPNNSKLKAELNSSSFRGNRSSRDERSGRKRKNKGRGLVKLPKISEQEAHTVPLVAPNAVNTTVQVRGRNKPKPSMQDTPDSTTYLVKWKENRSIGLQLKEVRLQQGVYPLVTDVCKESCCEALKHVCIGDIIVEINGRNTSLMGVKKTITYIRTCSKTTLLKLRHGPAFVSGRVSAYV